MHRRDGRVGPNCCYPPQFHYRSIHSITKSVEGGPVMFKSGGPKPIFPFSETKSGGVDNSIVMDNSVREVAWSIIGDDRMLGAVINVDVISADEIGEIQHSGRLFDLDG
ncbi:hypothetical protein RRF57_006049 [Xylaria bambusicola]|uniref:Uncharacterized protein n=1 Tax=Xylaria bambusicola TaxID=326684 RepID=A0AAN7UYU7_9PEZI